MDLQDMLNLGFYHCPRQSGKTCRCLLWNTVEAIWKTMDLGHRLKLEGLDYKITSQAVEDMFSLFGPVLDCKLIPGGPHPTRPMAPSGRQLGLAVPLEPKVLGCSVTARAEQEAAERHRLLMERLVRRGVRERTVEGDGNCQFRALSDQLYGSQEHHDALRQQVIQHLQGNAARYRPFVPGCGEGYPPQN
eukprot:symbB.v1.2.032425.t1/scaffold3892.1/size69949/4